MKVKCDGLVSANEYATRQRSRFLDLFVSRGHF